MIQYATVVAWSVVGLAEIAALGIALLLNKWLDALLIVAMACISLGFAYICLRRWDDSLLLLQIVPAAGAALTGWRIKSLAESFRHRADSDEPAS